eukprot:m.1514452 g.1514452  ORF g.1514452 m.1514452 type:complete len:717 (+) comp25214_c0_seq100:212-2362(+)
MDVPRSARFMQEQEQYGGGRRRADAPAPTRQKPRQSRAEFQKQKQAPYRYAKAIQKQQAQAAKTPESAARRRVSQPAFGMQTLKNRADGAKKKAADAGRGLARWFGIVDNQEFNAMQRDYVHRKVSMPGFMPTAIGAQPLGTQNGFRKNQNTAMVQAALEMNKMETSSESEDDSEIVISSNAFTRDPIDGLEHYRRLRMEERKKQLKPGWFGGEVNKRRGSVKAYRTLKAGPTSKKHTHIRDQTLVQRQLQAMPTFYPWFIYGVTTLQVIVALLMVAHAYTAGHMADLGIVSKTTLCTGDECPAGFNGLVNTAANRTDEFNWAYGPTASYLLQAGAKYSMCMRESTEVLLSASRERGQQCVFGISDDSDVGYRCDDSAPGNAGERGYACCKTGIASGIRAGMMSKSACEAELEAIGETFVLGDSWTEGQICSEGQDYIVIRPCCTSLDYACEIITEDECQFKSGRFHADKQLCSDTSCLSDGCGITPEEWDRLQTSGSFRNQPEKPNQWYRLFSALMIHGGVLQILLVALVQYYAGRAVETQAGFLRTMLIYLISGVGGYLISGIFSPNTVSVGANPAVYGLLAVMMVELFQAWQVVQHAGRQLAKISFIIIISLGIGTFPYVDNWSHIGGFAFGIVSGIVFLPYITFGKWDARRKKLLLIVSQYTRSRMCALRASPALLRRENDTTHAKFHMSQLDVLAGRCAFLSSSSCFSWQC